MAKHLRTQMLPQDKKRITQNLKNIKAESNSSKNKLFDEPQQKYYELGNLT